MNESAPAPLPLQCSICGGTMRHLFEARDYRRPQLRDTYRVAWCGACGYGRIAAALTPGEVAGFYQVDYYTHTAADASSARGNLLQRVRTHLAWRADRGQDFSAQEVGPLGRIVDIGCGAGVNLAKLRLAGFDAIGIEPDPEARQVASRYGPVHEGTAEDPPTGVGDGFDYALMSHVLEHTITPSEALRRAKDLLREGGKLIVEVPNCAAPGFRRFGPSWPWTDLPRHIHYFTRDSLVRILATAGFEVTETRYTGYTRQFQPAWIEALNKIHDELRSGDDRSTAFERQSWGLLLSSALASPDHKYDSIRVHARRR